jgi:glycosyltransferase involved in cell wall biosynthesis
MAPSHFVPGSRTDSVDLAADTGAAEPVFGFMLMGGALFGAQVRDIRLANELADRGYRVHVWWAMDRAYRSPLRPSISHHWLFHAARFAPFFQRGLDEAIGRAISRVTIDERRAWVVQTYPWQLHRVMRGLVRRVCDGVEHDPTVIRRFARDIAATRVTHLLPNLSILAPFAASARALVPHRVRYVVTFQGYELYGNYAREMGCEAELYRRLYQTVAESDWPAIAVSEEYRRRIHADIGLPEEWLEAIPPGVPTPQRIGRDRARGLVQKLLPAFNPDLPLVSYLGRQDSEKGLDLLLYAATLLRRRGVEFQLAICGPTAFGAKYSLACRQVAENLRCPVLWNGYISDELRSALFEASRCVVYPSIHEEPFGMVPVEAMGHGTPCLVPDIGGVAGVTQVDTEQGGLIFRGWDSAHLAEQLGRLLEDQALWARLAESAPRVAEHFSVTNLGDRVLEHLGLPRQRAAAGELRPAA